MATAIYIRDWHDPERGFEPVYRKGREVLRYFWPLDRFNGRVHTGETRNALRAAVGEMRAMAAIGLFDLLCQLTAGQNIERRGWLISPFGAPLTRETLPVAIESTEPQNTRELAEILFDHGWLIEREYQAGTSGRPNIPADLVRTHPDPVRTDSGPGAHLVRKPQMRARGTARTGKKRLRASADSCGSLPSSANECAPSAPQDQIRPYPDGKNKKNPPTPLHVGDNGRTETGRALRLKPEADGSDGQKRPGRVFASYSTLKRAGVSTAKARELAGRVSEADIAEAVEALRRALETQSIRKPSGYLVRILENRLAGEA